MAIETSHTPRAIRFKVVVTAIVESAVKRREREYVGNEKAVADKSGYVYGQWYEDVELKSETLFEQTLETLKLPDLVAVSNGR